MSTLTVSQLTMQLTKMYSKIIKAKLPLKSVPAVMLWGKYGVGKSDAIRLLAKELELETRKKVNVTDVRLLLFNPIDLRGIPTVNKEKTLSVWLKPKIFQMDESDKVINILFLDELSAAPQSVQAAAYQITLDRVIGEHKLPDNCIVIAAGNRVGIDKSVAYKMPKALANRLCHIEVVTDIDSWKEWAISKGINEKVIGFLSFRADYLNEFDSGNDDLAFPTPRSWEMVSNILNNVDSEPSNILPLIAGCVGTGIALEFENWCRIYHKLPKIEDIFAGKTSVDIPTQPDQLYALVSSMTSYAKSHKDDYQLIGNAFYYAQAFPADFTTLFVKNLMSIEKNYFNKLKKIPEFYDFIQKKGAILNGAY